MKLDTIKVYYLGDLSDEQKEVLAKNIGLKIQLCHNDQIKYSFYDEKWEYMFWSTSSDYINALTLFTQTKNERIAQIQLRIQELNNELIELDEEMGKLTYDKKEN